MTELMFLKAMCFVCFVNLRYLVLFQKHKIIAKLKSRFEFQISN